MTIPETGLLNEQHIVSTLRDGLKTGTRFNDPFPLTLFKPFSDGLYAEILAHIPEERYFKPYLHRDALRPDGTSTRKLFPLADDSVAVLPAAQREFWRRFHDIMRSDNVIDLFFLHLEPDLTRRFGISIGDIPRFPVVTLGRDEDGYMILPHPDSVQRVYTAQVYLAKDESQVHAGTTVYKKRLLGGFKPVRTFNYLPNNAFCFVRGENTFHGVERVALTKPRYNLHISCFQDEHEY